MGQIYKPGTSKLQDNTKPGYCRVTILFGLWQGPKLATPSTPRANATFPGGSLIGKLHLETQRLALAIAKKTLDENRFTAAQKTVSRDNPTFQIGDHVYFKNKQPGKWDLKWRPGYRIVPIECNGHYIHIENQATGKT